MPLPSLLTPWPDTLTDLTVLQSAAHQESQHFCYPLISHRTSTKVLQDLSISTMPPSGKQISSYRNRKEKQKKKGRKCFFLIIKVGNLKVILHTGNTKSLHKTITQDLLFPSQEIRMQIPFLPFSQHRRMEGFTPASSEKNPQNLLPSFSSRVPSKFSNPVPNTREYTSKQKKEFGNRL